MDNRKYSLITIVMKRLFALTLLAAFAVVSCTHKENMDQTGQSGSKMRFSARFARSVPAMKVAADYDVDVVNVLWEQDDVVGVFAGDGMAEKFVSLQAGEQTTLQGEALPDASRYYAMYPYDKYAELTSGVISTCLPAQQTAVKNKFASHLAVASTIGSSMSFKNVCTLVRVYVACNGLTRIEFSGLSDEAVAGDINVNVDDATYTLGESVSEVVTLLPPSGSSTFDIGTYYFSVLPQTYTAGIKVAAYKGENVYRSFSVNYSVTLGAGQFIGPNPFVNVETGEALGEGGIAIPEQLLSFAAAVNEGGDISSYCDAEGNVVLLDDIVLPDTEWTPIGEASGLNHEAVHEPAVAFSGVFDGQGYTISGLRLNVSDNTVTTCGFFGALSGATVRNLIFDDVTMDFNSTGISEQHIAIGTVAAYALNSTIANVVVNAKYSGVASIKDRNVNVSVGGIVGFVASTGQGHDSHIMECVFNGSITNDIGTKYTNNNSVRIGGIAGCASYNNNIVKITHCTNNAEIDVKAHCVAGIVAAGPYAQIDNCVNNGNITASYSVNSTDGFFSDGRPVVGVRLGGILGYSRVQDQSDSYIKNCTNVGTLSTTEPASAVGGIAGLVRGIQVVGCKNSGNVYSSGIKVDYTDYGGKSGQMVDGRGLMIGRIQSGQPVAFSNCYVCGKIGEHSNNAVVVTALDYLDYCYVVDGGEIADVENIDQNIRYWDWSYELELDQKVNDSRDEIEW